MKRILLIALLALPAFAEKVDLDIDPATTKVQWTLGDVLHTVKGTFRLKKGDLWFDPDTGKAGGLLVVDATSGESGSSARDGRMHKNVLESAKYPEITFAPDRVDGKVAKGTDSEVQLHGMFTIHGAAHEITLKAKTHWEAQKLTATLAFNVPYVKWGMKDPSTFILKVKDFVEIDVETTARTR